jgi:glycerophosphoryl diester phosphodiesterase
MLKTKELSDIRRPLLIGHRGYPARYPENTLAAFTGAMDAGCDMIELDVTLTRDRRVVVIHDDTLDRTTNGSGPVRDRTVEEMRTLDAGSWFAPRFAAERVPLLDEVIALTAGRCMLNIEIKESAFEEGYPPDAIEHQVAELVKTGGAMDRVIVSSFDRRILERLARMPAPPALAFISDAGADPEVMGVLRTIKAFSWHPRRTVLTREQVERVHAEGMKIYPWTINTRSEADALLQLGVDGLICNEMTAFPPATPTVS